MKRILFLSLIISTLLACDETQNKTGSREFIPDHDKNPVLTTAEMIAYKNGFEKFQDVSEISFTFNVDRGESHYERAWVWKPKSNDVVMRSAKDTVAYNRSKVDSITKQYDAAFINDKYWLLAPFNLLWDQGTTISEEENVLAPISKDTLNKLTLTYGNEGGYTPGDAYDFFYGKDLMIKEWIFRKGNDSVPSMVTTWEDYQNHDGIKIATMHRDSTANFKLYFTNISVKQ